MGLLRYKILEDGSRLGVWEIAEDYQTLFQKTYLNDDDIRRLNSFKNLNRKIESLSVRALLQQMTRSDARIVYDPNSRKPLLADNSFNISVTHSNKYTAILLNKDRQVGIDVEYMSHDIERLEHKFISDKEIISNDPIIRRKHLYVHWCAKEAIYKICGRDDIDFFKNIIIQPFECEACGEIIGILRNEEYVISYVLENNYVLAYCVK